MHKKSFIFSLFLWSFVSTSPSCNMKKEPRYELDAHILGSPGSKNLCPFDRYKIQNSSPIKIESPFLPEENKAFPKKKKELFDFFDKIKKTKRFQDLMEEKDISLLTRIIDSFKNDFYHEEFIFSHPRYTWKKSSTLLNALIAFLEPIQVLLEPLFKKAHELVMEHSKAEAQYASAIKYSQAEIQSCKERYEKKSLELKELQPAVDEAFKKIQENIFTNFSHITLFLEPSSAPDSRQNIFFK